MRRLKDTEMNELKTLNQERIEAEVDRLELEDEVSDLGVAGAREMRYTDLVEAYFCLMAEAPVTSWLPGWRPPLGTQITRFIIENPDMKAAEIASVFNTGETRVRALKAWVTMREQYITVERGQYDEYDGYLASVDVDEYF